MSAFVFVNLPTLSQHRIIFHRPWNIIYCIFIACKSLKFEYFLRSRNYLLLIYSNLACKKLKILIFEYDLMTCFLTEIKGLLSPVFQFDCLKRNSNVDQRNNQARQKCVWGQVCCTNILLLVIHFWFFTSTCCAWAGYMLRQHIFLKSRIYTSSENSIYKSQI